jgi:LmbE family N-acetylglucosaminyl deacetylase
MATRPGTVVVTVFAGRPPAGAPLTRWDAAAGFAEGEDVMGERLAEDRAALAVLGARGCWLPFPDAQYGGPLAADVVAARLADAVLGLEPGAVTIPLGLFHDDHKTTHTAALGMLDQRPDMPWLLYADALYRRLDGLLEARLAHLRVAGLTPVEVPQPPVRYIARKRRAVACYRSQLRALGGPGRPGYTDVFEPERYWSLAP